MKQFTEKDLFISTTKTYPKVQILVHDGKIYYNKEKNDGNVKLQDLIISVSGSEQQ